MDNNKVITAIDSPALTQEFKSLEARIRKGQLSWYDTGKALLVIGNKEYFNQRGFNTVELYVSVMFDISRNYYHKLTAAARIYGILAEQFDTLPINESQCRPLTTLEDKDLIEVWQSILDTGKRLTAKLISTIVSIKTGKNNVKKGKKGKKDKKDIEKTLKDNSDVETSGTSPDDIPIVTPDVTAELSAQKAMCIQLEQDLIKARAIPVKVPRSKMALELYRAGYKALLASITDEQKEELTSLYKSLKG